MNGETFSFSSFFLFFPTIKSEILKNLNICPSKDRHLTCYTCYPFADFLHYGVMDLVKSFWSHFVWVLAMRKIQKEPGSIPKGLEFSYNGKSGMIPNYVTTPLYLPLYGSIFHIIPYPYVVYFFPASLNSNLLCLGWGNVTHCLHLVKLHKEHNIWK